MINETYECRKCNGTVGMLQLYRSEEGIPICRNCAMKYVNEYKKGTFTIREILEHDSIIESQNNAVKDYISYIRAKIGERDIKAKVNELLAREEAKSIELYNKARGCLSRGQYCNMIKALREEDAINNPKEYHQITNGSPMGNNHKEFHNYYNIPYNYDIMV